MRSRIRLSKQSMQVLEALLVRPGEWHHGYAISKNTGILSGTLYPILMRLEKLGWLETRWRGAPAPGRPPRHQYRPTPNGREWATQKLRAARESTLGNIAARQAHG